MERLKWNAFCVFCGCHEQGPAGLCPRCVRPVALALQTQQAAKVPPALPERVAWGQPIGGTDQKRAPGLDPAVVFLQRLSTGHGRASVCLVGRLEQTDQRLMQTLLVALDSQQVVGLALSNRRCRFGLAVQGVGGDGGSGDVKQRQRT